MILWSINPSVDISLDFGEAVTLPASQWTPLLPRWVCIEAIDAIRTAIKAGQISVQLQDISGTIYNSTDVHFMSHVLPQCVQQLSMFKTDIPK